LDEKKNLVVPGERLGVIEEFTPSGLTYEDRGQIRSLILGQAAVNKAERSVEVSGHGLSSPFPLEGSVVEGIVENMTGAGGLVRIYTVNGEEVSTNLTGVLRSRDRQGNSYKLGDVVRAVVTSLGNNNIWLSIDDDRAGILRTFCSICGGNVTIIPPDKVSCMVCGNIERRKLVGFRRQVERRFHGGFRGRFREVRGGGPRERRGFGFRRRGARRANME
jgi:exosome complex component CSL4